MNIKKRLRENSLSIALITMFLITQVGLTVAGWYQHNDEQRDHAQPTLSYGEYLRSSALAEATAENWESEFLQMYLFVILTTHLYQKGSATSKNPDGENDVDADPRAHRNDPNAPWPVRRGGFILRLYEESLGLAFLAIFLLSFGLHAWSGAAAYSEEQVIHGNAALSAWEYMATAQFWFESLQNWQSEFFSLALMVIFTIFLRQRHSPESKPVATPHAETPA